MLPSPLQSHRLSPTIIGLYPTGTCLHFSFLQRLLVAEEHHESYIQLTGWWHPKEGNPSPPRMYPSLRIWYTWLGWLKCPSSQQITSGPDLFSSRTPCAVAFQPRLCFAHVWICLYQPKDWSFISFFPHLLAIVLINQVQFGDLSFRAKARIWWRKL